MLQKVAPFALVVSDTRSLLKGKRLLKWRPNSIQHSYLWRDDIISKTSKFSKEIIQNLHFKSRIKIFLEPIERKHFTIA